MNILIVDDHPLTASVYANIILDERSPLKNARTTIAHNCNEAYHVAIETQGEGGTFDLAIIDYNLPSYKKEKILTGGDLALFISKHFPKCRILIITSHTEVLIIYDLLRRINPHGIASKNDINTDNLSRVIQDVLKGNSYRSPQIKACIEEVWSRELMFDDYNRKILLYLAKGYKIKDLEDVVMLSVSAIQKRLVKLKKVFEAQDERELMKKIFEQGFL